MSTVTYARPASRKEGGHFSFLQIPYVDICDKKKERRDTHFSIEIADILGARPPAYPHI